MYLSRDDQDPQQELSGEAMRTILSLTRMKMMNHGIRVPHVPVDDDKDPMDPTGQPHSSRQLAGNQ
jgi:hypothetical protein